MCVCVGGCLVIFFIKNKNFFFARFAVDIRLTALFAILVLGHISTDFEREKNVDSTW